jgi:hypothetical protein
VSMEEKVASLEDIKLHHRTLVWLLDVRRKLNDERRRRRCLLLLHCDIGVALNAGPKRRGCCCS